MYDDALSADILDLVARILFAFTLGGRLEDARTEGVTRIVDLKGLVALDSRGQPQLSTRVT